MRKRPGFSARYWNNTEFKGEPAATAQLSTPFHLCTSGATVFAPGVNLTDFSAVYQSVFTPRESGDAVFDFYCYGSVKLLVDGKEVKSFTNKHGSRPQAHAACVVEAGKSYDIEIRFNTLPAMPSSTSTSASRKSATYTALGSQKRKMPKYRMILQAAYPLNWKEKRWALTCPASREATARTSNCLPFNGK
ncbi:MAG: PA14 domain-containing protein [Bacteroides stercoris]